MGASDFQTIMCALFGPPGGGAGLTGIDVRSQFRPEDRSDEGCVRNFNAAFLITLCGTDHPLHETAIDYLTGKSGGKGASEGRGFYMKAGELIRDEIAESCRDQDFRARLSSLSQRLSRKHPGRGKSIPIAEVWRVFFPEGTAVSGDRVEAVQRLRRRRTVRITRPNSMPLRDPAREVLFTANALLTIPSSGRVDACETLSASLRGSLEAVCGEPQRYWYDHPVPVDVSPAQNEIIHGLKGLQECMAFEITRGMVPPDSRLTCALSVSTTHEGLREAARPYLEETLREAGDLSRLDIYAFTEREALRMVEEIVAPAARHYFGEAPEEALRRAIGVDGEYGRHYSFLKALPAFWQVLVDPGVRGTFKIDLDQVFPQEELVRETGRSAFEHLCTPLWGAEGMDAEDRPVRLGMLAGALVNESDLKHGLFTPDVPYPKEKPRPDHWVFFSTLPQAVSTEAEMMARYGDGGLDGRGRALQRVHVTGGTCGILLESLRRYRPFTPGMIGRAEDQAYLLSVLFSEHGPALRYLHASGLIMRHDKNTLVPRTIRAARAGKEVGDLVRILLFTRYANALPWSLSEIKGELDPFTGCFMSRLPHTVVSLRFALRTAALFEEGEEGEAMEFHRIGVARLGKAMMSSPAGITAFREAWEKERHAWDVFYDVLDRAEKDLEKGDGFAGGLKKKAMALVKDSQVHLRKGE